MGRRSRRTAMSRAERASARDDVHTLVAAFEAAVTDRLTRTFLPPPELVARCLRAAPDGDGHHPGLRAVARVLEREVRALWARGWQPVELVRQTTRKPGLAGLDDPIARMLVLDVQVALTDAETGPVHARWVAQIDELRPEAAVPSSGETWFEARVRLAGCTDEQAVTLGLALAPRLRFFLPERQVLLPPPGEAVPPHEGLAFEPDERDPGSERELERVRALLAKAESTPFAEEAEAFTAKAQDLMTRYGLTRLMVETGSGLPAGRRLPVDEPYAWPKYCLLAAVAGANRCRAVSHQGFGDATVLGYPDQLDVVAVLYTSLLTQATAAMLAAGRDDASRRTRSFRHSFLLAFASGIGQRLRRAAASATEAVDEAGLLLPVLAERDASVDAAVDALFGRLRSRRSSASNLQGWSAGADAASRALLGATFGRGSARALPA